MVLAQYQLGHGVYYTECNQKHPGDLHLPPWTHDCFSYFWIGIFQQHFGGWMDSSKIFRICWTWHGQILHARFFFVCLFVCLFVFARHVDITMNIYPQVCYKCIYPIFFWDLPNNFTIYIFFKYFVRTDNGSLLANVLTSSLCPFYFLIYLLARPSSATDSPFNVVCRHSSNFILFWRTHALFSWHVLLVE